MKTPLSNRYRFSRKDSRSGDSRKTKACPRVESKARVSSLRVSLNSAWIVFFFALVLDSNTLCCFWEITPYVADEGALELDQIVQNRNVGVYLFERVEPRVLSRKVRTHEHVQRPQENDQNGHPDYFGQDFDQEALHEVVAEAVLQVGVEEKVFPNVALGVLWSLLPNSGETTWKYSGSRNSSRIPSKAKRKVRFFRYSTIPLKYEYKSRKSPILCCRRETM